MKKNENISTTLDKIQLRTEYEDAIAIIIIINPLFRTVWSFFNIMK